MTKLDEKPAQTKAPAAIPVRPLDDVAAASGELTVSTPLVVFGISAAVVLATLLVALGGEAVDATLACGLLVVAPLLVARLAGVQAGLVSALACLFGGLAVLLIVGAFSATPLLALLLAVGIGCFGSFLLGVVGEPAADEEAGQRLREMERDAEGLREQLRQSRDRADAAEQRSAAAEKQAQQSDDAAGKLKGADRQLADAALALTSLDDRARNKEREVEKRKRAVLSEQLAAATEELAETKRRLAEFQADQPAKPEREPTPIDDAVSVDDALRLTAESAQVESVVLLLGESGKLARQEAGIASAFGDDTDHEFARTAAARVAESGKPQVFTDLASIEADEPRTAAAVALPGGAPAGVLVAIGHGSAMDDKLPLLEAAAPKVAELAADQSARVQVDRLAKQIGLLQLQLTRTRNSLASTESALVEARSEVIEDGTGLSRQMQVPLANLRKYANVLQQEQGDDLGEVGGECITKMSAAVTTLEGLAGELQQFGTLGRREIVPVPTKVVTIVDAALERMSVTLASATVRRDSSIAGVPEIMGDADALGDALDALLDNAAKFHRPGTTPTIEVAAEKLDDRVRIWVRDDGIGMPKGASDSVFLPFERLHPDERYHGSGIGLAVAARVARRLGGAIGVESDVGQGSAFWLDLPVAG
ncbi:MAG: ATP-binding protein [Planctomycetota bacterium]